MTEPGPTPPSAPEADLERILAIPLTLNVVVAQKAIRMEELLNLQPGDVIEFEKPVEEPLTVEIHGTPIARGTTIKRGEKFGLKISSIVPPDEAIHAMGAQAGP